MTSGGRPEDPWPDQDRDSEAGDRDGLRPTGAGVLVAAGCVGIVGGWLLHPLGRSVWGTPPFVTWLQVLTLVTLAVVLGATAWSTDRALHVRHERMEPHRAVNRLAMGRAGSLVGALAAGAYAGYAISWLGVGRASERLWMAVAAAVAALLVLGAGLLLERACRVRPDGDGA